MSYAGPKPDSTLALLGLLLALVLGFIALWSDPLGAAKVQELGLDELQREPARFWGRAVRISGTIRPMPEGGQAYALEDWAGRRVVVQSQDPPRQPEPARVIALVGQEPANILQPWLLEFARESRHRSWISALGALGVVGLAGGFGIGLVARLERRRRAEGGGTEGATRAGGGIFLIVEVLRGPDQGKSFELRRPINRIGRPGERVNDISLSDPSISRSQGCLRIEEGQAVFENESATNPTQLEGHSILRARVLDGQCLEMGQSLLRVRVLPDEASP